MTTSIYSSVINHTSDAAFRTWGAELSTNLAAVGLVQTADTGQVNWATVAKPAARTAAGYEIWRFADSSLYMKLEYGSSEFANANTPGLWLTVGTGSNGSGVLTGQLSTRTDLTGLVNTSASPVSTTTNYATYVCHTADAFSLVFKANSSVGGVPMATVCVGKTVDNTGAATGIGFGVLNSQGQYATFTSATAASGQASFQSVRIAAAAQTLNQATVGFAAVPGNPASSLVGSTFQIYPIWMNVPQVLPFQFGAVYVQAEVTKLTTFSLAIAGTTPHTYLALGTAGNSPTIAGQSGSTYGLAFIFE